MSEHIDHGTLAEALVAILGAMPAISKDGKGPSSQGSYAYRGIEQIVPVVRALCAQHGVVIVPRVTRVETVTVDAKQTDTHLDVDYLLVHLSGETITASVHGIGRDNSDKGANKAFTQAFKAMLTQVFQIADGTFDNDDRHDERADEPPPRSWQDKGWKDQAEHDKAYDAIASDMHDLDGAVDEAWREQRKAWKEAGRPYTRPYDREQLDEWAAELARAAGVPGPRPEEPF